MRTGLCAAINAESKTLDEKQGGPSPLIDNQFHILKDLADDLIINYGTGLMSASPNRFLPFFALLFGLGACDGGRGAPELELTYYRIFADYSVKDTGENIFFDYVVVCGGYAIPEAWYTHSPQLMFMPTSTGEAVSVLSPELCHPWYWGIDTRTGQQKDFNPRPDDFVPFTMWHPDVENLGFAFGYASDLAYESPYSRLVFNDAKIERSNRETWEAWHQKAEQEYVQIGGLPGPWGYNPPNSRESRQAAEPARILNQGVYPAGAWCFSVPEISVPEGSQTSAVVEEEISGEEGDYIKYVSGPSEYAGATKFGRATGQDGRIFNGGRYSDHLNIIASLGVRRSTGEIRTSKSGRYIISNGGGRVNAQGGNGNYYHDVFPVVPAELFKNTDENGEYEYIRRNILLEDAWNGFSLCSEPDAAYVTTRDVQDYASRERDDLPVRYHYEPIYGGPGCDRSDEEALCRPEVAISINGVQVFKTYGYQVGVSGGGGTFVSKSADKVYPNCCTTR